MSESAVNRAGRRAGGQRGRGRRPATSSAIERLLSVGFISDQSTIPASTLYTLIARGELPVVRLGKAIRVRESDFLAYVEAHRERS